MHNLDERLLMLSTSHVGNERVSAVVRLVPSHVFGCLGAGCAEGHVLLYPHSQIVTQYI